MLTLPKLRSSSVLRVLIYLRPYWVKEILMLICMLCGVGLSMVDPLIFRYIIDTILPSSSLHHLNTAMVGLFALYVVRGLTNLSTGYLFNLVGQRIVADLRRDLYDHLQNLDLSFFSSRKTGDIISRVNGDVATIREVVTQSLISLLTDSLKFAVTLGIMFSLNWQLTLISILVLPPFALVMSRYAPIIRTKMQRVRERAGELLSFFQESFPAVKLIQAYSLQERQSAKHRMISQDMVTQIIQANMAGTFSLVITGFIASSGTLAILWYGGSLAIANALTVGSLVAFDAYLAKLFGPLFAISQFNVVLQRAGASLDRVYELLDTRPSIQDRADAKALMSITSVEFKKVFARYGNAESYVAEDLSFGIERGKIVALVGSSGSGKSTIAHLICRFYDPVSGMILVNNENVRGIRLTSLREQISFVSQDVVLFNGTIRENILLGKQDATRSEIVTASQRAHIHDVIDSLPDGYETVVGDRGVGLSGGERQRIALARAFLKDAPFFVLDEVTSALDPRVARQILAGMFKMWEQKAILLMSHRLSDVINADRILVLRNGRIVEAGSHATLLGMGGEYATLWSQQDRSGHP